jgi:hypothetical protein
MPPAADLEQVAQKSKEELKLAIKKLAAKKKELAERHTLNRILQHNGLSHIDPLSRSD